MSLDGKRVLWGIDVYTRVNHLLVHEELIRRQFGDRITVAVYTGNELFERFPDSVFRYKEDVFYRNPDDPSAHTRAGSVHGGSHNGHRDACNYFATLARGYDYVIETPADCVFSDYSAVERMFEMMASGGYSFMSPVGTTGRGRLGSGPYVYNEFIAATSEMYCDMFPILTELEGKLPDGSQSECFERVLGDRVLEKLGDRSRLVIPGARRDDWTELEGGLGSVAICNLWKTTAAWMRERSPANYEHVMSTCFPDGLLYDVRPNYDPS